MNQINYNELDLTEPLDISYALSKYWNKDTGVKALQ